MARYGKGYYHDLQSLIVGINEGLQQALYPTAEDMKSGIESILEQRLYKGTPLVYERLMSNGGVLGSVNYEISDNEIHFYFDDDQIKVERQAGGCIAHKYINDGWTTNDMISVWSVDEYHDDIEYAIRIYLRDEFPKIYRKNCRALGIKLE